MLANLVFSKYMQLVAVVLANMCLNYTDRSGIKSQVKHSFSVAVLFFKVILSDLNSQRLRWELPLLYILADICY